MSRATCRTVLIGLVFLGSISTGVCQSPCPNYFSYQIDDVTGVTGRIQIPDAPKGVALHIRISLSIPTTLPSKYVGRLELASSKAESIKAVNEGRPLIYLLYFPIRNPIPLLTEITFNGQRYCTGPRAAGPIVTTIFLEHTLYPPGVMTLSEVQSPPKKLTEFDFSSQPISGDSFGTHKTIPDIDFSSPTISHDFSEIRKTFTDNNFSSISMPGDRSSYIYQTLPDIDFPQSSIFDDQFDIRKIFSETDFSSSPAANSGTNTVRPALPTVEKKPTVVEPTQTPPPEVRPPVPMQPVVSTVVKPISDAKIEKCGRANPRGVNYLIANGQRTSPGQWPWLAAIFLTKIEYEFQCAGSLVTEKHVITAAHCKFSNGVEVPASAFLVCLGRYRLLDWRERGSKNLEVLEYRSHPDYHNHYHTADADLAVIVLRDRVVLTPRIQPLCLWSGPADLHHIVGRAGYVIGWGKDERGNQHLKEPRMAQVPIVSQEDCLRSNVDFVPSTSNRTMCAGGRDGSGPCNGDSGSGLIIRDISTGRYHLRGVVSLSLVDKNTMSCDLWSYIVYADTAKYMDWITSQTNS